MLMMGLRLGEGIDLARFAALGGAAAAAGRVAELAALGLVEIRTGRLRDDAAPAGRCSTRC